MVTRYISVSSRVPIIPIVLSPLKPQTDLRGRRLEPHEVTLRVLEPVYAKGPTHADEEALRDEVRALMQRTLDDFCPEPREAPAR